MKKNAVSADEFDRVAQLHCQGWEPKSVAVVRALLVANERSKDVANQFGITPQHANVLKKRFLDRMNDKGAVKVPATEFMKTMTPPAAVVLERFRSDLKQLVAHGYTKEQIGIFLSRNDVQVSDSELAAFLATMSEHK